jgi:hypothetical protein
VSWVDQRLRFLVRMSASGVVSLVFFGYLGTGLSERVELAVHFSGIDHVISYGWGFADDGIRSQPGFE